MIHTPSRHPLHSLAAICAAQSLRPATAPHPSHRRQIRQGAHAHLHPRRHHTRREAPLPHPGGRSRLRPHLPQGRAELHRLPAVRSLRRGPGRAQSQSDASARHLLRRRYPRARPGLLQLLRRPQIQTRPSHPNPASSSSTSAAPRPANPPRNTSPASASATEPSTQHLAPSN